MRNPAPAKRAYAIVARRPKVLAQLPCFCHCDRSGSVGHKSLYSCFTDLHGANCDVCKKEAHLADRLARNRQPVTSIRTAVIHGDWQSEPLPR